MHTLWEVYIPSCKDGFTTLTLACSDVELRQFLKILTDRYEKTITTKKVKIVH